MMRPAKRFLLAMVLVVGCMSPDPVPRFSPAWEAVDVSGPGWISTRKALLCADCQFNNLYSKPLPERNLSAESMVATAIRPPQLDLFSADVLKWILRTDGPKADVILHLGDAANVATTGEFDRFLEVMASSGKPWFMAPGNHDCYYYGIYAPQSEALLASAANGSGVALGKDQFIRTYVATILGHDDSGCAALSEALGVDRGSGVSVEKIAASLPASFEWQAADESDGLLHRICWNLDEETPWHSYILQCIDLTHAKLRPATSRAILLDSCQYTRRPAMVPNAWRAYPIALNCGLTGQMLPDQLRKVREWVQGRPIGHSVSFMCHHPFESLEPRTRTNIGYLWRECRIGLLVTAHTHQGYFAHHNVGSSDDQIELNIGSTTDWPMEWRSLQGFMNREARQIYVHSVRTTLVEALQERDGFFQAGWEIPTDAGDDYRMYKQGEAATGLLLSYYLGNHYLPYWLPAPYVKPGRTTVSTDMQIKDTLLCSYRRLLRLFPTDPKHEPQWPAECASDREVELRIQAAAADGVDFDTKIDLLIELEAFERSRHTIDPETGESADENREKYKISQAAWASRFMKAKGRRLRVEDEMIRVDWDRAFHR